MTRDAEATGRALADPAAVGVERPQVAQVIVRPLEEPADGFLGSAAPAPRAASQSARRVCSSARVSLSRRR